MNAGSSLTLTAIRQTVQEGAQARVSDDTMRWLFGTPDASLTPEQQFLVDFLAETPNAGANRARRAFCARYGLTAKQDKQNGYWTFTQSREASSQH